MENLKKLAVLLSGVAVVVLMAWVLTVATQSPTGNMARSDRSISGSQGPAQGVEDATGSGFREYRTDRQEPRPGADSIAWRSSERPEGGEKEMPRISGKYPPIGNPNHVFVNAARRILPTVVSIHSMRRFKHPPIDFLPFFRDRDPDEGDDEDNEMESPGSGSGILISPDGYIMTNYHVVEDASDLNVILFDKREYVAELVGGDPTTDVAVLKIEGTALPAAFIGNSDSVQIGEWVMAIGNPLNFTSTVTTGIVSALGRNINIIDTRYRYRVENFIQTDAVINPGNSGGALVNLDGEVIGMNTAIATRNGYYQGYGFAIPVNLAKKVVDDILRYGRVRRAILGVVIQPVDDEEAKREGMTRPMGARIESTGPGSPADKAGMQRGDIILAVDGESVNSVNDLQIKIAQHQPGDTVTLLVWRDRRKWEVDVELGEAPAASVPAVRGNDDEEAPEFDNLGISLRGLSADEKERYNVTGGLLIESVTTGSPAEKAGVIPFSILVSIDGNNLNTVEEFDHILEYSESGKVLKFKVKEGSRRGEFQLLLVEVP